VFKYTSEKFIHLICIMDNNAQQGGNGRGTNVFAVLGFLAIVLLFAFWWYSWRPTQIKKDCFTDNGWTAEYYKCLMKQGIDEQKQQ